MNPAAPSPSDSSIAQAFRDYAHLWPLSWAVEFVDKRAREIDATTSAQAAPVGADSMLTQALTDPENQPSQWGTIPLSMLPARMDDSRDPFPIDAPDYEDGYARGWNACLDRIATPAAAVGGDYSDWLLRLAKEIHSGSERRDAKQWGHESERVRARFLRYAEAADCTVRCQVRREQAATPTAPAGGFVVVPREPTEKMVIDGFESEPDAFFSTPEEWDAYEAMTGCQRAAHRARLCWAAMIAASPAAQSSQCACQAELAAMVAHKDADFDYTKACHCAGYAANEQCQCEFCQRRIKAAAQPSAKDGVRVGGQHWYDPKGEATFKNFHRSLCDRFGCTHDPEYWWRDLISLEEHIAKATTASGLVNGDQRALAEHAYTMTAFDYASAPVGSRDWTLYWKGWQAAIGREESK